MRFTTKTKDGDYTLNRGLCKIGTTSLIVANEIGNKLGQIEDIEEELGIDLVTLFKAIMNDGLVYIKFDDHLSKCFNGNNIFVIDIGICCKWNFKCFPCFTVPFGTFEVTFFFKDYGKTWALTKEELE